uniref:YTH domain-containing protein n=1 Tax=Arcella intermedia TaxID=1963864 RepID=A0A6B2LCZ7_9EUKA
MAPLLTSLNPVDFETNPVYAKFFVIKSYSEDDVHKSIKYSIWASTDNGNKRLDKGWMEAQQNNGPVYLFFSVNASGQFCGLAEMTSPLDYATKSDLWHQDKWNGQFSVKWIFIKDIPNNQFRHIKLINNENKPVTNSRDTQEVQIEPGRLMLKIFQDFKHKTSILDDFEYYNQEEEKDRKFKQERKTNPNQHQHQHQYHNQYQHPYHQPNTFQVKGSSNNPSTTTSPPPNQLKKQL